MLIWAALTALAFALEVLAINRKPSPLPAEMLAGVQRLAVNGREY